MLWLFMRESSLKFLTPLLIFLPILVVATSPRVGVYLWSDITWSFNQSSALSNPIVAGFFAFEGARFGRIDVRTRLVMAVRPARGVVVGIAGGLAWISAAALLTLGILAVYLRLHDGYGSPIWSWLGAMALGTLVWALLGYAIGAAAGRRWYIYVATVFGSYFMWLILTGFTKPPYWLVQMYPTALNGTNPFVRYIYATITGQSVWYLGLTLLILAALLRQVQARTLPGVAVGAVLLCIAGALTLVITGGQFTTGFNSRDYICSESQPEVCTLKPFAAGNKRLSVAFAKFDARVRGTALETRKLEQQVEGVGDSPSPGARSLYLEDLGPGYDRIALEEYIQRYGGSDRCTDADLAVAHSIVESWLAGERSPFVDADGDVKRAALFLARGSVSAHASWFKTHYPLFISCKLSTDEIR